MYSISNRDSFKMIPTLQKSIQRTAGHDPVFILVGNKADIDTDANTFGKPTLSSPLLPPPPPPSPTLGMETYRNITETRTGPTTEISESESDSTHMSLYGFGFTDYTNGDTKFNPEETTSVSTIVITSPSPTHSPWPTRGISTEEGQELARQLSCAAFFETSASTGECVENVIREAVRILREVAVAGRDGPHSRELRTKQERSWIGGLYDRVFGRKKSNGFRGEDGAEKCKVVVKEWNGCGWEVVEL
ncbi:hypothetical protein AX16_004433 [Volvariella volvacea WC 439]|nr:hypothetical protein AX16_004433 [Volvariella volvacea WC 439]